MPHVSSSGVDDLASSDEVKVYKDEGEEENRSSENLAEDKVGLLTETEEGKTSDGSRDGFDRTSKDGPSVNGDVKPHRPIWNPLLPYPYPSGATFNGLSPLTSLWSHYSSDRPFGSPPPAHMGIPPVHLDPKCWARPLPIPGNFNPFYPELSTAMPWTGPCGYSMASSALRGPYPPLSSSPLSRFSPGLFPPHPGLPPGFPPHAGLMSPGCKHEPGSDLTHHPHSRLEYADNLSGYGRRQEPEERSRQRIKKPLNAFMLFMKEMRPKVIDECSLKESAAINQILGRKWHALDRAEQAKYYEIARKEKELHLQLYPGWSARDNYGTHSKNKKKRKAPGAGGGGSGHGSGGSNHGSECGDYKSESMSGVCTAQPYQSDTECVNNPKKCRARFGLDQQNQWCKPCRRKKKCIRFLEEGGVYSDDEEDAHRAVASVSSCHSESNDTGAAPSPARPSAAPPTSHSERTSGAPATHLELPILYPCIPSSAALYYPHALYGGSGGKPATLSRPPPSHADFMGAERGAIGSHSPSILDRKGSGGTPTASSRASAEGGERAGGGSADAASSSRTPLAPANQQRLLSSQNMILAT